MVYSYLITDGKLHKIGKSENPQKRIKGLAQGNPSYRLLGISDKISESKLHKKYRSKRIGGEWFDLSENQVKEILKSMETGELSANNSNEMMKQKGLPKFNEFEKGFYARVKSENGKLEKNENGAVLLIHKDDGKFTPELLIDFPKCNMDALWMVKQKSRDFIVNYELSNEQKGETERLWHEENIQDLNILTQRISGDPKADGRSKIGRSLRAFLASKEFNYKTIKIERLPELILDDEQKEFIKINWRKKKSIDIARELFNEPELPTLAQESRVVESFIENLRNELGDSELSDDVKNMEGATPGKLTSYRPPTSLVQLLSRINKYLNLNWEAHSLKKDELTCCQALKRYMTTFSFVRNIDNYKTENNRMIFEDRFIRYCYNKPDLSHEDLDLYVLLCAERVNIEDTAKRLEEVRFDSIEEREQNGRISQATSDLISATQTAYNSGCKREEDYLKALTTQRSKRLDADKNKKQVSILHLVKAIQDEEFRQKFFRLGLIEKDRITEETQKISDFDSLMAVIHGIGPDEILGDIP